MAVFCVNIELILITVSVVNLRSDKKNVMLVTYFDDFLIYLLFFTIFWRLLIFNYFEMVSHHVSHIKIVVDKNSNCVILLKLQNSAILDKIMNFLSYLQVLANRFMQQRTSSISSIIITDNTFSVCSIGPFSKNCIRMYQKPPLNSNRQL